MEGKQKKNRLWLGILLGTIIGFLALMANGSTRKKVIKTVKETKDASLELATYVKENRELIYSQVKATSEQLSDTAKKLKDDIATISTSANQIKESSKDLVVTTKDALDQVKISTSTIPKKSIEK
ncbi:YtxH domain-containing protein [Alkalihalobacillus sp. LMS39]|uniref:YtxH domain-containing protein n=1 Tax=Alkalihalobacillus sp. LMS39 TaxID=2924032 RepID=UPI001FB3A897|nr:YtxH domain-containing protein [Alkalihalobacillus sp. LMS39]UOE94639.1 YtxH domain-containing protein [Alkalihalobacillus sp. LMS39]